MTVATRCLDHVEDDIPVTPYIVIVDCRGSHLALAIKTSWDVNPTTPQVSVHDLHDDQDIKVYLNVNMERASCIRDENCAVVRHMIPTKKKSLPVPHDDQPSSRRTPSLSGTYL